MSAYYNEHDPFAAAWLRELITDGLIADGEVDERDIQTLDPDDLRGFTQCHFFAGIGGWSYALRLAGWPDDRPVWTGSCPCQPFSAAGTQAGGTDPRHLWPAWYHLIRECRPPVLFGEQVESAVAHGWLDLVSDDLEREGYAVGAVGLPAASVGAPHIRQRLWFVAEGLDDSVRGRRQHEPSERCVDGTLRATGQAECVRGAGGEADPVIMAEAQSARSERLDGVESHGEQCGSNGATNRAGLLHATVRNSEAGELADAQNANRRRGEHGERRRGLTGGSAVSDAGELADAQRGATERRRHDVGSTAGSLEGPTQERQRLRDDVGTGQFIEQLGHPHSGRRDRSGEPEPRGVEGARRQQPSGSGAGWADATPEQLGHTSGERPETTSHQSGCGGQAQGQGQADLQPGIANPWDDLLWLPCRDGKARPTQPGLFPLAHGISNRVGILRGAGNAIVPQVAAAFINAYLGVTA